MSQAHDLRVVLLHDLPFCSYEEKLVLVLCLFACSCGKWRKLPANISPDALPDEWHCNMNTWDKCFATCETAEEEGA